jgi:formyl-CoA transferase
VLERPDLLERPEYADNAARVQHSGQLAAEINGILAKASREMWAEKLRAAGIPAGIPRTVEGAFRSPEMAHRNLVTRIPHPTAGEVPNIASPLQLSATPVVPPAAAPALGQHTAQVLRDLLGLADDRIASLAAGGAIATGKT